MTSNPHHQHRKSPADKSLRAATWLVCESGDRWRRAVQSRITARRNSYPLPLVLRSASSGEVRALATHTWPLIVLWEVSEASVGEMAKAISLLSRYQPAPRQFVAWPADLPATSRQLSELNNAVRQLGADLVLSGPEMIEVADRYVIRFLNHAVLHLDF